VLAGEPLHCLGVSAHRLGGLPLGGQVQADELISGWKLPASSCLGFLEADSGAVMIFLRSLSKDPASAR
jgi:hypothetical protein